MVTREEVWQLAKLAKLSLSEEELDALSKDMEDIVNFADTINEANAESSDFENCNNLSNVFRGDEVVPSYPKEEILKNAPCQENGCFQVKKRG